MQGSWLTGKGHKIPGVPERRTGSGGVPKDEDHQTGSKGSIVLSVPPDSGLQGHVLPWQQEVMGNGMGGECHWFKCTLFKMDAYLGAL